MQQHPLGLHCRERRRVVQRLDQRLAVVRVLPRLQGERALPRRGQHDVVGQRCDRETFEFRLEPFQSRRRQHQARPGGRGAKLAQARVDVAPDIHHLKISPGQPQLRRAPDAAGRETRLGWKIGNRAGPARDENVPRIGPDRHAGHHQPVGILGREILEAVHRDMDAAVAQRLFEFAGEHALVPGRFRAGGIFRDPVALRLDRADFKRAPRPGRLERRQDDARLRQRQRAAACAENNRDHGAGGGLMPLPPASSSRRCRAAQAR